MANSAFPPGQAAVVDHEAAADPHGVYLLEAKAPIGATFRSGRYYPSTLAGGTGSTTDPTDGLLICVPFIVGRTTTFDRIAAVHQATTSPGATYRMGIYSDTSGRPDALVLDAGTIDLSTAAATKEITISQALTPGVYWLAGARQGSAGTATMRTYDPAKVGPSALNLLGVPSPGGANDPDLWAMSQASVTGALPNPFTGTTYIDTTAVTIPIVWLRAA